VSAGRLRILHLHSGNMMGGIESMLLTLAECAHLSPEFEQQFALVFDGEFAATLREKHATVHLLPLVRLRHLPSIMRSRHQLAALLKQNHFDAVIAHSSWTQLIFANVVRQSDIPLLFWMHGPFDGHWLQKLASFQPPDFVICNSEWTRSTLDRCYPRVPSTIMYYPVSPRQSSRTRDEVRRELGVDPDETLILMAARMEPWKGHRQLLRALPLIRSQLRWRVLIAGGPNTPRETGYFESLKREASELDLSAKVRFLGYRSDVSALMMAAEIHCQPNEQPEPFGIVFVEALQAGVSVVTFAMGGPREILDRNTGILVPPGDLAGLAAALSRLIENPKLRSGLGMAGPARAQALCDPAQQIQMFKNTVQNVIARGKGAAIA